MDQWIQRVEAVSDNVSAVRGAVDDAVNEFLVLAGRHTLDMSDAEAVSQAVTHGVANSSNALVSCLTDLGTMSRAMKDAMDANPAEAHTLTLNLFNVFIKQLTMYYKETYDALKRAEVTLRQQQVNYWNQRSQNEVGRMSTSSMSATMGVNNSISSLAATTTPEGATNSPKEGSICSAKSNSLKGGKKKKKDNIVKDNTILIPEEQQQKRDKPKETEGTSYDFSDENSNRNNDENENGNESNNNNNVHDGATTRNRKARKDGEKDSNTVVQPSHTNRDVEEEGEEEKKKIAIVKEPTYLHVATTIEDTLGHLVLSSRPNVFTAPEVIERRTPIMTYYISLPPPSSLGLFLLSNYIALEDDMQADLMCDVLHTDCVEVVPFESLAGEIVVEDPSNLHELPACGWRIGSSEDRRQMMYTLYILINREAKRSRSLLIQDSLVINSEREEVLHEITPVPTIPNVAKVTVRGFDPALAHTTAPTQRCSSDRLLAIVNITKSMYEKNGFVEVKKEDLQAVVKQQQSFDSAKVAREKDLLAKPNTTMTPPAFQGTVELASLEQPGEGHGWGFSDVAKGAVRGAAAVVLAPVSVGKAVGNAVLDVSGVTGAIKQQVEGLFRKSFPHLASEEIIQTFNCALVDEGNPIPKQGFLFITPHWLCFQAGLLTANFSLEWDEIKDIKKQRSVKVFENSITVCTHLGGTYFLTSFVQRDQAYTAMMKEWLRK